MPSFTDEYGPWAFVAGASMGIGAALSHEAARRGLNVFLLARGAEQLRITAEEIRAEHGVEVGADLGRGWLGHAGNEKGGSRKRHATVTTHTRPCHRMTFGGLLPHAA